MKKMCSLLLSCFILLMCQSAALAQEVPACGNPDEIIVSWTGDPQTTMTVAWRNVSSVVSGQVQYMKQSEQTADFSGAQAVDASCTSLYDGYNHFEAKLENLEPGTAYVYRVGTGNNWSEAAVFTTAAATNEFSFMYMGDTHIGYNENSASVWENLLAGALKDYPDIKFALSSGDIVDDAVYSRNWQDLLEIQARYFKGIPLMPAIGNHENEDLNMYRKSFALPQNGPEGMKEQHYSFDYGNAHFVVLDSNLMGSEGDSATAGMAWLENDLQNTNKEWKFVMFHHPAYEVSSYDNSSCEVIKQNWVPILEENDVDLVFVGHQHMYMRTYPMAGGQVQQYPADGITYVMGVSGNKTYLNPDNAGYIAKVADGEDAISYSVINIEGDVLNLTTVKADGTILDEYKISKDNGLAAKAGINSVKLLNGSNAEINSVSTSGTYRLQAHIQNYTSQAQTVSALFQVRCGAGANAEYGGEPQGISSMQLEIPAAGADIYTDFTLANVSPGAAYADVYILDESGVPIDVPFEFSFNINS